MDNTPMLKNGKITEVQAREVRRLGSWGKFAGGPDLIRLICSVT